MLHVNSVRSVTPPKFPSVRIVKEYYYVVWGAHKI